VTGAAKPKRVRETTAPPDLTLVPPPKAESPAPAAPKPARSSAAPPVATTEHPWRYLHPSRVWPD
jgi:hypothetical protein